MIFTNITTATESRRKVYKKKKAPAISFDSYMTDNQSLFKRSSSAQQKAFEEPKRVPASSASVSDIPTSEAGAAAPNAAGSSSETPKLPDNQ